MAQKWFYIDQIFQLYGPHDATQMQTWYNAGYLDKNLYVIPAESMVTLSMFFINQTRKSLDELMKKNGTDFPFSVQEKAVGKEKVGSVFVIYFFKGNFDQTTNLCGNFERQKDFDRSKRQGRC